MPEQPPTAVNGEGDDQSYEEEFRAIGEILDRDAEQVLEKWYERAKEKQTAAGDPGRREEVLNELLQMLRSLAQRLSEQTSQAMEVAEDIARGHGRQRSISGWTISEVVRDYEILHQVTLEHLGQQFDERLSYRQAMVIALVMDTAVATAVERFNELSQRELHQANEKLDEQVQRQKADLRRLAMELADTEYSMRQRIARTLHDDIQQLLTAIRMRLEPVRKKSADPSAVESVLELLNQTVTAARNLTTDLRPVVLEEQKSLQPTLEWLADMMHRRYELAVEIDAPEAIKVEQMSLRVLVFDAVRELLFNTVKHAETDRAWVTARQEGGDLHIEVEDRGVGSEATDTAPTTQTTGAGFGLSSIRHRIRQIGGDMEMHSKPGEGTRVALTVPLDE